MAEIHLWGGLRPAAGDAESIDINATTIRELMTKLEERYPLMSEHIDSGIAVSINGTIYRDSWAEKLPADAEIYLLPRIQGG
jgi:molybdopterin synthase sulfur carrier subunit